MLPSSSSRPFSDAASYDARMSVVTRLGAGVLDLLAPRPGERILDLGCGTGHHAAQLAAAGCLVEGVDAAERMIARARELYPAIPFRLARAEELVVEQPVDAVFSNAALHWMPAAETVAARVFAALRPGGRFVGEFGGKGNVARVMAALRSALAEAGAPVAAAPTPWYFPTPAEYAAVLEAAGFVVEVLHFFPRPTPLEGEAALADWYRLFAGEYLALVAPEQRDAVIARALEHAAPTQWVAGRWVVDYQRLRFRAIRPQDAHSLPYPAPEEGDAPITA
ncbi:MAG: class I SAM-dependent methyltransferase [Chloroflexota bacterium]|nr:class I SAM-dependent methyltransferase [Dehalococcoidia bacterium]MDW8253025.1 class I SAM-dependent methyltransferase [Chloroflexota bacterium]